ncbi:MAG: alkaline phosphatase family protein [Myxococcota bacterium]|jgi:predicted AlkP superfamily pyrophosphatase or phosphodiesterase|nr:alkaline phosphatase family protein [Myxococcota bacterium]
MNRWQARRVLAAFLLGAVFLACSDATEGGAPSGQATSPADARASLEDAAAPPGRVLVIGVDGASLRLVKQLMGERRLPNLAAILRAGGSGVSRPMPPLLSPRIWTSVATGKLPSNHGVEGWVRITDDGTPYLYSSRDRRARALWNIASAAGMRVGVVNWLMTHPPEVVNGVIVSDHAAEGMQDEKLEMANRFAQNMKGAKGEAKLAEGEEVSFVSPPEFRDQLERARNGGPLSDTPNPFVDRELWPDGGLSDFFRRVVANDEFATRVALEIEAELRPELMMVYLPGIDRLSHFLWVGVEPPEAIPEHLRWPQHIMDKHGHALKSYYEFVDALIGRLVAGRGPNDLVMVMSDHGFETNVSGEQARGAHDSLAARDGILILRGKGVPVGRRNLVFRMTDMAPTLLSWLGLPPALDMDGKPTRWMSVDVPDAVASYDDIPIEHLGTSSPDVDSRIIENLKELGYVE